MPEKIAYDFSIDSIVSVDAPVGTNPESLHGQVLKKLLDRLLSRDIEVRFENTFDSSDGTYSEEWDVKGEGNEHN